MITGKAHGEAQWVKFCNYLILVRFYWLFWSFPTRVEFLITQDFFHSQRGVEMLCKSAVKAKSWEGDLSWSGSCPCVWNHPCILANLVHN